ncbi:hypothetical protein AGDE_01128 [Angomonas deanei]|nr:hypothetical protein AGDE_01128 [Angomonas deanei]|eukprot:EPY42795.1 hypothetical protein AGDE_01128 [Angomonas deanei]
MVNVVKVFYEKYKLILVTGDVELMRFVKTNQRKVGKKSVRRESLAVDLDDERRIGFIDVNESGKRFVPVWRSLIDRVTRMRKEVGVDSDGDYYVV